MQDSTQKYPNESVQNFIDPSAWWESDDSNDYRPGRLVKVFIPHIEQIPYVVVPKGRSDPTEHKYANVRFEPLDIKKPQRSTKLPVAGLPVYGGEVRTVYRAKKRPAIIISEGGFEVPYDLRIGKPKWQTAPTILVAPYYGSDEGGKRAGFNPELLKRIRLGEYPQFVLDWLPIKGSTNESILRLDHIQPVGYHYRSIELTEWRLSTDALAIIYEWIEWLFMGSLDKDGILALAIKEFVCLR